MILNEFFYKYPCLQLLIHSRLSYVAIRNSVTTSQPILSVVERYQEWKWPQLFFFWKYCKTPFTALLILTKRRHSQLFKSLPIWRRGFEKKIERWGGGRRGVTALRAGIYWIWHVSSWRDISIWWATYKCLSRNEVLYILVRNRLGNTIVKDF